MLLIILSSGCGRNNDQGDIKSLSDLENAISIIRERRKAEFEIIDEENYTISILKGNIEKSNSDGMKEKIRDEIFARRAVITKAKKNIANQDVILKELLTKKDSIEQTKAIRSDE